MIGRTGLILLPMALKHKTLETLFNTTLTYLFTYVHAYSACQVCAVRTTILRQL